MRKNYFLSLLLLMITFWQVEASNGSKSINKNGKAARTTVTIPAPPAAPSGLSGSAVGGDATKLNLTWTDNSVDETEFEIAYSTDSTTYLVTPAVAVTGSGSTGATTLNGLTPNTTYYIWVRALRADVARSIGSCTPVANEPTNSAPTGNTPSCWSNLLKISTGAIPAAPTNAIVATPYSQRTNTVYFNDNSADETEFIIERSSSGGAFTQIATMPGVSGTGQRSYVDNTTLPNTQYQYRIYSKNIIGQSVTGATTASFITPPDRPIAPNSLGLISVNPIGLNFIKMYWRNGAPNAIGFYVQQSSDNNSWFTIGTVSANSELGFTATNLNEGQRYFFRVIAFNSGGDSDPSNVLPATTLKRVAPNPAFNLTAKTISTTQIDLKWNLGTQDGVTNNRVSQEIYRSSVSATDGFIRIATIGNYEDSYSDNTCSPKTTYWYKILTANFQGQSPYSNLASATTLGPPYAPTELATALANDALGNTVIKVTWKDNSNDEWGFALERSTDETFATGVLKADLDSNTVTATSLPIEEGVTYFFRISASNQYGASKYSSTVKLEMPVTATPNAPYDLKGKATSADVSLTWGDDSNKEAGFEVERSDDGKTFTKIGTTARNEVTYVDKTVKDKTKYSYRVRATNIKGNSDYTNVLEITTLAKASAGIEIAADEVFQVYPNPTSDGVKVSVSENLLKGSGMIIITDNTNRVVSKTLLSPNQTEYRLDLNNYSEGTYTISLRTDTQQLTKRVYKF